ncbi:MAG TPA: hypothetical protein VIH70_12820 [Actinomycetota bacterium]
MGDRPMTTEQVASALTELSSELAYPATPSMRSAVTARLENERAAGARPVFPRRALWSRRRVLVLAAIGLLAALALAAAARFAIGAIEIRVQRGVTPSASAPPVTPDTLGDPLPVRDAIAIAGFEPSLPAGPAPDEAYMVDSLFGDPALLFAWRPSTTYPAVPGTKWGLVLMAFQGDDETVVKSVQAFEDVHPARVDGAPAAWIPVPHVLELETERGFQSFSVRGNVLIWQVDDVTYRMETSLDRASATAVAQSAG